MDTIHAKIAVAAAIVLWLITCLMIYRVFRHASWLAGSTAASCLFFLGATVASSFLVKGSLSLAPLWFGILVLLVLHLYKAQRKAPHMDSYQAPETSQEIPSTRLSSHDSKASYI